MTQVTLGANTTESYSYSPAGNRLSSLGVGSYTVNNSNEQHADQDRFDRNNRVFLGFENRLASVTLPGNGGTVSFKYDPFGRRIYKSSPLGTSIFAYDGYNLVEEANSIHRTTFGKNGMKLETRSSSVRKSQVVA